jgi:hypothetical protein
LLTFLNDVINDSSVTQAFMTNSQNVMHAYGLSNADQDAITASGSRGKCTLQDAQAIVDLIIPELMANYNKVW